MGSRPLRCPECGAPLDAVIERAWLDAIAYSRSGTGYHRLVIEIEDGKPVHIEKTEKYKPGKGPS